MKLPIMKPRNKKIIILATAAFLLASASVLYYQFVRKPSQVVNGSATLYRTFTAHTAGVHAVEFSPTGETLASGSIDSTAKIWRRDDGQVIQDLKHPVGITTLTFSRQTLFRVRRLLIGSRGSSTTGYYLLSVVKPR